jgi:hypothetical protein
LHTSAGSDFYSKNFRFGELIYEKAKKYDVDPALVAAIIKQESHFDPSITSPVGAQGLMQIMPKTGSWLGATDLNDPRQNVEAGVKYVKYLSTRFNGNLTNVLAAYNGGEGNVKKYGGVPPFKETQKYVTNVLKYYDQNKKVIEAGGTVSNAGGAMPTSGDRPVSSPIVTDQDLLQRAYIVGCAQIGPGLKPCTRIVQIVLGLSAQFKVDGETPILFTLKGITDGVAPGVVTAVTDGMSNSQTITKLASNALSGSAQEDLIGSVTRSSKGLFGRLLGAIGRALKALKDKYHELFGEKYSDGITIKGSPEYREKVRKRLDELKGTSSGKAILNDLDKQGRSGKSVTIKSVEPGDNHCQALGSGAFPETAKVDPATGRVDVTKAGKGSSSDVGFNPDYEPKYPDGTSCRSPAIGLGHELLHAKHNGEGRNLAGFDDATDPGTLEPSNHEEAQTIGRGAYSGDSPTDNSLRTEMGYKPRTSHGSVCP